MKKRIYTNMMMLIIISLFLVSGALCLIFYSQFSAEVRNDLRNRTEIFKTMDMETVMRELAIFEPEDMRITLIHSGGAVEYDNSVGISGLQSHLNREEVSEALASGFGESKRFSATLGQETYYYSVRLADGSILRAAKTTSSILGMFSDSFPIVISVVMAIIIIGYLLAGNLTKRIITPINKVNLNGDLIAPYDELVPFIRTIEEQRRHISRQFEDLQRRADTISAIMDNMSEGIILVGKTDVILSVNKSAASIFEADTSMEGKNILELIRDVELLKQIRGALSGNRGELNMERAGKTYRVFFSPVTDSGAIILFLDITEKAMGEKMRREFSANVSHELKTPLTSIYGNAEMLCNDMVKETDRQKFYGKIKGEAARLIALTEDIITISKLDEGKLQDAFEDTDIAAIAAEAVESLSLKAAETNVSVNIHGNARMPAVRSMLYELFYNLIDNAIKYNKTGGTVDVKISQTGHQTKITVSDTGIGIPKESQGRVFERFYRVDKSRSKKTGGTGLGLAISKHIVLAHGGNITLTSRENEGTIIKVTF